MKTDQAPKEPTREELLAKIAALETQNQALVAATVKKEKTLTIHKDGLVDLARIVKATNLREHDELTVDVDIAGNKIVIQPKGKVLAWATK